MATIGTLIVNIQLNNQQYLTQINRTTQATSRAMQQMQRSVGGLDNAFLTLRRTFLSFFAISTVTRAVKDVADYADAWKLATNQIAAANSIATLQARSMESLNQLASESRSSLADTAELYARLLRSTEGLAKSESEVAKVTSIVTQAFKAGGASMQEAANGARQLGQSLASGIFQGDELRSIRENAPLLAQAIAAEFHTTIGGLKALGAEGKLTADRVFKAILENSKPIEDAFKATNATIADSFTVLNNSITEYLGELDSATGVSKSFTKSLLDMAQALRDASKAPTGTSDFKNTVNDLLIVLRAVSARLVEQKQRAEEAVGGAIDLGEAFKTGALNLLTWLNPALLVIRNAEAIRKAFEQATDSVETFHASQGRTGVGGVNLPTTFATGGGRGFTGPGVGGFSPSKETLDAIMKWREEAKGATGDMARLAAAAKMGQEAFDQMNDRIEAENFLLSKGMPLHDARAQQYIAEYVAAKQAQRGIDDLVDSTEELKELQIELAQTGQLQTALGTSIVAYNDMKIHIEAVNMALRAGVDASTEAGRAWVKLAEDTIRAKEELERMEERVGLVARTINSTISSALSTVSSSFANAVVEGEKFRDMLDSLLKDLARLALNAVFNMFLQQIFGALAVPGTAGSGLLGLFGGGGGGGPMLNAAFAGLGPNTPSLTATQSLLPGELTYHKGGIVGEWPRFHNGLMPNEMPAILQKGEGVFTPDQMKALGGKTENNFTVINQTSGRVDQEERRNSTGGTDITVFIRETMTKEISDPASNVHKSLKANFGLSQNSIRR
jgi:tape measure domain-containing protein